MEPVMLGTKNLASYLGESQTTILRWRRTGKLPRPVIDERQPRWSKAQIDVWLHSPNGPLARQVAIDQPSKD